MNNIIATINHVTFESQIADHDFLNQITVASFKSFHHFNSSLILSKIRILASIAIPIERINQAIEARVKTTHKLFIIDNINAIYINNATADINQANL
jgi:hypothetical protein